MKKSKNYTLKVLKNGQEVGSIRTHSIRLFLTRLRSVIFQKGTSVYLRVSYGKKLNNVGTIDTFYNDGFYENEKDLFEVFEYFNDEN